MLDQMPIPGLEGTEAGQFLSLIHDALAQQLVSAGGLGLADQIEQAMGRDRSGTGTGTGTVTSGFGYRPDPLDRTRKFHDGIDLAAPEGSPIHVLRPGVVTFAGKAGGYGNLVVVDHGDGLETRYGHCASLAVKPGDRVSAGDTVATVGSTGRSTGPHVHYEVRRDGIPVDPTEVIGGPKAIGGAIRGVGQRPPADEDSP
jgi:murein DD-endopeptidase MepM/ murein hydrolase activator NlpD